MIEQIAHLILSGGPWALGWVLAAYLLYERRNSHRELMTAYKEGAESNVAVSATIESLERSMGIVQRTLDAIRNGS